MTALEELLAKVEAGECRAYEVGEAAMPFAAVAEGDLRRWEIVSSIEKAYDGSLDAAKALHEAVLGDEFISRHHVAAPDRWHFYVSRHAAHLDGWYPRPEKFLGIAAPARVWLIAILKALIAKEKADG